MANNTPPALRPLAALPTVWQRFVQTESSGSIVLLTATALALFIANSSFGPTAARFWETVLPLKIGEFDLSLSVREWVDDGLMVLFFLLVGLEIKREFRGGELANPRQAALPIAAAVGGMIVPALVYTVLNHGTSTQRGWGTPMATDIAFALGVLALLGKRIPTSLRVFLAALAIVDDLGAVLVIALFYSRQLDWSAVSWAFLCLAMLVTLNFRGVRTLVPYALLGVVLWLAILKSGIHPTIAGVMLACTIPLGRGDPSPCGSTEGSPLERLEEGLAPWVGFGIMPLFALANAGVQLGGDSLAAFGTVAPLGILLGLVVGKPLGILGAAWLTIRKQWSVLPTGSTWSQLIGVSFLGGIGFTMALFIAGLAFGPGPHLEGAKIGILGASLVAALTGSAVLVQTHAKPTD